MKTKGIYKITNTINGTMYIGSSVDIGHRFKQHLYDLSNNKHRNQKLQRSVNKYGIENFTFSILSHQPNISRDDLLELEELILHTYDKEQLFNISFDTSGGGSEANSVPTYLLDLEGNIVKEFQSTNECYREFYKRQGHYASLNTDSIVNKKYRIVTKEFYDSNIETIKSWKPFSSRETLLKEYRAYCRPYVLHCNESGLNTTFNSYKEIADYLNITVERIRQCHINNTLFRKNFLITKLNKPEDFKYFKYI